VNSKVFARRINSNRSTDSICTHCYRTIATQPSEIDGAALSIAEADHYCDEHTDEDHRRIMSHYHPLDPAIPTL